jgi:anti-anti-sigma factor
MAPLEIISEKLPGDIVLLSVTGKLDTRTCVQLKDAIREVLQQIKPRIMIDLSRIDFLCSVGAACYSSRSKACRKMSSRS